MFKVRFKTDDRSHLIIKDHDICRKCAGKPCTHFCPAGVYEWEHDHIAVGYEGCVECGTCRIGCPSANIEWLYPRGGYGVAYKCG